VDAVVLGGDVWGTRGYVLLALEERLDVLGLLFAGGQKQPP
jgi:hypothetical protein